METEYQKLGLKVGLELHIQLETTNKRKLFCNCSTTMKEKNPIKTIVRYLHPVASEMGEIDKAAQYEFLRGRKFIYQIFKNETCEVELDEEPPHEVNSEALTTALQIALMLNCDIPDEIHVMRKIVIDGSNTTGFQRTMIVGMNGWFEFKGRKILITQVTLEEDAAAIVSEENGNVTYRLNRFGIPLVEIDTDILEGFSPEEIQEIAYTIGLIAKSTGKVKRGIGSIRQDINVSIEGGNRVEIKGVQELNMLSKVIDLEIKRQLTLIKEGKSVEKETRAAKEDGTTEFMRPLPGAERMYPETDCPPIVIDKKWLEEIKNNLPESWDRKLERFKKHLKLSDLLAKEIIRSDYLSLFEKITMEKNVEPSVVASFFTSTLKDLNRRGEVNLENLDENIFFEIFDFLEKGRLMKEALPEVIKYLSKNPMVSLESALEDLKLNVISLEELRKIIYDVSKTERDKKRIINIVMSKVRGRADPKVVIEEINKLELNTI
jgi:Glu-tRNA(Gln) amidotransferase subunit E-like FAD-binding protein